MNITPAPVANRRVSGSRVRGEYSMVVWKAAPSTAPGTDPRPPITAMLKTRMLGSVSSTVPLTPCWWNT